MDLEPTYTFVEVSREDSSKVGDKSTKELFKKWGVNLSVQDYLFNEPFYQYHKYQLAEAFFKDQTVANSLKVFQSSSWIPRGTPASTVDAKQIPCSVLNMSFFDKLKNPENNIVHDSGTIIKRFDTEIDRILVADNLRGMLLDEDSDEYFLYDVGEREEFILRLFQMLVLGGELCQYEDELEPYLKCTKNLYKDLISVQMDEDSQNLSVMTIVLEVVAKDHQDLAYFPRDTDQRQNIAFLLIDPSLRRLRTVSHQFAGYLT